MLSNTPAMLEAHFGVPMVKAVLHSINTRLDATAVAFQIDHAGSKVLIVDREFSGVVGQALALAETKPLVIDYDDPDYAADAPYPKGAPLGDLDYEDFVDGGDADFKWSMPDDEWDAISLNYTSGTTGNPKGVVYHHRGAALMAYANTIHAGMGKHPVYFWTLPMFHCNGWCFPWTLAMQAGTHVCLRWVRAKQIYDAIADHGVTHLCGAPVVMSTLINAKQEDKRSFAQTVTFNTAAAPPPEAVLSGMADAGFAVTHLYGLTETYGPAVVNEWHGEWDALDKPKRTARKARQGVRYAALEGLTVMDPATMQQTPADGETIGEVMFRGNIVMKGYLRNRKASDEAFAGGWFHSGDLGVMHPGRLYPDQGPLQGHHHFGRRKHLVDRGRGRALQASRRGLMRRGRAARREMGRDAGRLCRAEAWRDGERGRDHRALPQAARPLQVPEDGGVCRNPQDVDGQDPEIPIARTGPPASGQACVVDDETGRRGRLVSAIGCRRHAPETNRDS